jgi:glycine betaine/proline transport system ATP-binding protein
VPSQLRVSNLYKIFGPRPESVFPLLKEGRTKDEILHETGHTVAVGGVSFVVQDGEIFVIMGLSGSGKSTVLRCLNRLIEPTRGEIWLDEQNVLELNTKELRQLRRQKISVVFQRFGLLPHLTVLENVEFGLKMQNIPPAARKDRALTVLESVGLKGYENSFPSTLSGGMQQRVGLARALATDPHILLLDEPFSALDPLIRREMQTELVRLQEKLRKTMVFITHDLDEALRLGDHIAIMKDGIIVQVGTPEEILMEPATDYVRDFVQGVNRARVLTAANVMKDPDAIVSTKAGPRVALRKMEDKGISSIFVVDRDGKLEGILTAESALKAATAGAKSFIDYLSNDYIKAPPEAMLTDLIPQSSNTRYPIAITTENNKLVGIVVRASILEGLANK